MYLPNPSESTFTPPPAGTHLAICYRVVDLGTQQSTFNGKPTTKHQILLSWELPDEQMEDGRPFVISRRFTWSMHEKAALRQFLESWRGKKFADSDFGPGGFDIRNIIEKPCTLTVVHEGKNGTTYANITGIGKVMKGVKVPDHSTNEPVYLWMHKDRWDAATFSKLSGGLQASITRSPEYHELMKELNGDDHEDHGDYDENNPPPGHYDDMRDEIPF